MKRRLFLSGAGALMAASCARMDQRAPRYDENECPFCIPNPGVCFYCKGSTKCHFCEGTGKRTTVTPYIPNEGIEKSSYEEECPYCKGSGVCRYCEGSGKCWACEGTGHVDHWEFYRQYKQQQESKKQSRPEPGGDAVDTRDAAPDTAAGTSNNSATPGENTE
ncbi:MAG: hypothetical protein GF350_14145 [Chitinivibrionales bacterium]|nr:hypothetical protein [Chitinivibrionales bacterium]